MSDFKKALLAADLILKGESVEVSADELETAMMSLAESRRESGESSAQAFARLAGDRDSDIAKLYAAMDVRRIVERHARVLARRGGAFSKGLQVMAQAEENLDLFIKMNTQPGESHAAATARLARDSARFGELYASLDRCRRLVAG